MGVFGTSTEEENKLREAVASTQEPHQSHTSLPQSAYDTASETKNPDYTIGGYNSTPAETLNGSDGYEPQEIKAEEQADEDNINRQYSMQRIASNRSFDATEALEEISRRSSHATTKISGEKVIRKEDLDWDGDDDKDNPQNFAPWRKWLYTMTVALVCLCCSLGSSLYVSGVSEIVLKFHVSQELAISGLTFYILGLAFGPVLTAPLSEVVGRRVIYVVSFPISMLFAMGVGLSPNMRTILVLRFFTGYFASPALSIAGGTISDLWANEPMDLSFSIALFCLAPFMGPVIGPIIGGFAAEYKGWKWAAAWVPLMFMGAILPFLLIVPETYKPVILERRAKKRGYTVIKPEMNKAKLKEIAIFVLFRPLEMLFLEPIVFFMSVYISFVFAVLFGFFEAFPIIFRGVYKMDLGVSGLPFIGVGLGLIFGVIFYIAMDNFYYFPKNPDGTRGKFDDEGKPVYDPPEKKLLLGKVGAVCLPISLFWLGWTGRESVHWMAPTAAGFPFGFGLILIFFSVVLYFSMSFPPLCVASAIAANNLLRYILASVFPLFTVQMYQRLHIGWATSLFAFISLAMVPVPFVFERYGKGFRARSKFGYAAYFKQLAQEKAEREARKESSSDVDEKPEEVVANSV